MAEGAPKVSQGPKTESATKIEKSPEQSAPAFSPGSTEEVMEETRTDPTEDIEKVKERLGIKSKETPIQAKTREELSSMDFYQRLGLDPSATPEDIKSARKVMFGYHPDHGGDEEAMKLINEAYEALSDPSSRSEYDASTRSHSEQSQERPFSKENAWDEWERVKPDAFKEAGQTPFFRSMFGTERENPGQNEERLRVQKIDDSLNRISRNLIRLSAADPDEFIKAVAPRFSRETSVRDYKIELEELARKVEIIKSKGLELEPEMRQQAAATVLFLGKSKFKKWLRGLS